MLLVPVQYYPSSTANLPISPSDSIGAIARIEDLGTYPSFGVIQEEESDRVPMEEPPSPDRERLRILLIGSSEGVFRTIQTLEHLRFVETYRWSQRIPAPKQLLLDPDPGEVLSVLTRYWRRAT